MDAGEAGKRGGVARAAKLSSAERQRIAREAARARWGRAQPGGEQAVLRGADLGASVQSIINAPCAGCAQRAAVVRGLFEEFAKDVAVRQAIGRIPWGGFREKVLEALE